MKALVLWEIFLIRKVTNMKKLSQLFESEIKEITVEEFPSYLRERTINENCSAYCLIDISKDKEVYPYLKHGDWEYYWFSFNWKFLEKPTEKENAGSIPCLIVLDPRKLSVRRFIEERVGKDLFIILESSSTREEVIENCPKLLEAGTEGNEDNYELMDRENLTKQLKESPYKLKKSFFKHLSGIWIEKDDKTVLGFCKTKDEEYIEEQEENKKEAKKDVDLFVGDMMASIANPKKEHKIGDTIGPRGFGIMAD